MSPRSQEFLDEARDRLEVARLAHANGFAPAALSAGYYAMLYAARAALSEEELYAKTHAGVWSLFGETFVADGRFDRELAAAARRAQRRREAGDYEAASIPPEEAAATVEAAARFVDAVSTLLGAE